MDNNLTFLFPLSIIILSQLFFVGTLLIVHRSNKKYFKARVTPQGGTAIDFGVGDKPEERADTNDRGFANYEGLRLSDPEAQEMFDRCIQEIRMNRRRLEEANYLWADRNGVLRLTSDGVDAINGLWTDLYLSKDEFESLRDVKPSELIRRHFPSSID